jgi:Na+-transporting NADH:ubiquinone oxidoreductase subunit A
MGEITKLKRGFDIKLLGSAEERFLDVAQPSLFALKPTDVFGIAPIPKLHVKEGDEVRAGEPLFYDKLSPRVQYCSPVSGEVVEVRRGPKRAITAVVILADREIEFREAGRMDLGTAARSELVERMLASGVWPLMRQRPFNVVPDPDIVPRDIFVSCFDSAPLAPDFDTLIEGSEDAFSVGLRALRKLTDGEVHLGVSQTSASVFSKAEGVRVHTFAGPHPAGNVGIQIHHIAPVRKGDSVWTIKPQDVATIGRLVTDGVFDAQRTIAITGSAAKRTGYFRTRLGASIKTLTDGNVWHNHVRFISGNVLTGTRVEADGFIGLFDDQITVIEEGDRAEFLGWLIPSYKRPSMSRSFLSFLFPNRRYDANTNMHGDERAFVMTGEYEKVLPMDVYPQHLLKSILYRDFDQMEGLGIYEVVEEDLALCEFVCTSKQPVQRILREGLDAIRIEG